MLSRFALCSFQDLLQYIGVFFIEDGVTRLVISNECCDSRYVLLNHIGLSLMPSISAKVSLDRVTEFLQRTELLESFADKPLQGDIPTTIERDDLGFNNATFSWSVESPDHGGTLTPSQRTFRLHISGEQLFKYDCINLIIGPT